MKLEMGSVMYIKKNNEAVLKVVEGFSESGNNIIGTSFIVGSGKTIVEIVAPDFDDYAEVLSGSARGTSIPFSGYKQQSEELESLLGATLYFNEVYSTLGIEAARGILIIGSAGVGKSQLISHTLKSHVRVPSYRVSIFDIATSLRRSAFLGGPTEDDELDCPLRQALERARLTAPAVVVLEDLDLLCQAPSGIHIDVSKISLRIINEVERNILTASGVCLLASCRDQSTLPAKLRSKDSVFSKRLIMDVPSSNDRLLITQAYFDEISFEQDDTNGDVQVAKDYHLNKLTQLTAGYVAKDLAVLSSRIIGSAFLRHSSATSNNDPLLEKMNNLSLNSNGTQPPPPQNLQISWSLDVLPSLERIPASQKLDTRFDTTKPDVRWEDVQGYKEVKKKLQTFATLPIERPDVFERLGVEPARGILLYGPSGCGKTMLVHALASSTPMNYLSVKGNNIYSKYLGDSEASIRKIFATAKQLSPCLVFFDDIDTSGMKTGHLELMNGFFQRS
ncbi:hypothetical protein HDV05_006683 [Chytridiales sp. JEL 0842]|nr:hypothetical protein HDV05_006683 [Chytridiales sp. JEL 0842]